ncbi:PorP/SprF family type IX secretion system membrane protein [Fulvivirga ligni]|uniref:PorP/SprF family type IX secretion system membrane protein n=1 Tax=Fulvivirga ligni TaxID=2904246 RepID=UPI001F3FA595|nr:PorP/SprF family type IX secretion system membrane protein [Fulvivirga ligni]UII23816.1 PorP/SprF family type IX secretion system membrane protein [Fulvivirga ligni]
MRLLLIILFTIFYTSSTAQYFQFSQYDFTPERVNPAFISASNHLSGSIIYRRQSVSETLNINTADVFVSYPLLTRRNKRWSAIGLSFLDDRSGLTNIYKVNEMALTYALYVPVTRNDEVSLGAKALYQNRRFSLDGLYTGSQYVPDRGFLPSVDNGEEVESFRRRLYTLSFGLGWRHVDRYGHQQSYVGISFFDFNKPQESFYGEDAQLPSTVVLSGSFLAYEQGPLKVFPEAIVTKSSSKAVLNLGAITRYDLMSGRTWNGSVNIITKYNTGGYVIGGLQLEKTDFKIGFSYDLSVSSKPLNNAFEVGLAYKTERTAKRRNRVGKRRISKNKRRKGKRYRRKEPDTKSKVTKTTEDVRNKSQEKDSVFTETEVTEAQEDKVIVVEDADSVITSSRVGDFKHHSLKLDETNVLFHFDFNSVDIDQESLDYIRELSEVLKSDPNLKVKIVGHTDSRGSAEYNKNLSLTRCNSVKNLLLQYGVNEDRVEVVGMGEEEPSEDNNTAAGRAKNRRVEFILHY